MKKFAVMAGIIILLIALAVFIYQVVMLPSRAADEAQYGTKGDQFFVGALIVLAALGIFGTFTGRYMIPFIAVAFEIAMAIYARLPVYIVAGGYIVISLIALSIILTAFVLERIITLRKVRGKMSISKFLADFRHSLARRDIHSALKVCNEQRGSMANILRAGLDRFLQTTTEKITHEKRIAETQRAMEEANMLEVPILERNLIAINTIATIAVLIGLLGTTIGMIRAFQAMAHAGAPDAIQLALGISEALINTAGGLINAIGGIVAYNFFLNRVDNFNYQMDEAAYEVVQFITGEEVEKK